MCVEFLYYFEILQQKKNIKNEDNSLAEAKNTLKRIIWCYIILKFIIKKTKSLIIWSLAIFYASTVVLGRFLGKKSGVWANRF